MADYRNITALVLGVTLLQLAGGVLGVITPLGLASLEAGSVSIGAVATLNSLGFMIGAWQANTAIRLFGNIRVHAAAGALTAVTILLMHMVPNLVAWAGIRIVQGISLAWMFASLDAWLGAALPTRNRGSISGFYHFMAKIALIAGPFFAFGMSVLDSRPYMWGAIFIALSMLPICLTRRDQPPPPDVEPLPLRRLIGLAPSSVFACFMAGVINTGTLSLLPLYAVDALAGLEDRATSLAAIATAAVWIGGVISQWPAGKVSDRVDRRLVIALMVGVSAVAAFLLGLDLSLPPLLILLLLAIWGAGSLSFYGIAVAHIIDWAPPAKIPQVMTGLLFVWAVGSMIGPLLAGLSLHAPTGARTLFLVMGGLSLLLVLAQLVRRASRPPAPEDLQEPWSPTTPLLVGRGEVDPRV